jgi:hypothetical protein
VRFRDVESAEPADPLVALLHLAPDVPRAAADLPLVHAAVAAEGPPRQRDRNTAPAADRLTRLVAFRLSPLIGCHNPGSSGTHLTVIGLERPKFYMLALLPWQRDVTGRAPDVDIERAEP